MSDDFAEGPPTDPDELDEATLERIGRVVRKRPEYWAWVFEQYEQFQGTAAGDLPRHLGVSARDLLRLSLYLRPRADHFQQDVTQTASAFGIDRFRLADVARFVDNVLAMRGPGQAAGPEGGAGFLVAARRRRGPREDG